MKLYAKAANDKQIKDRIARGADGIEVQLLSNEASICTELMKNIVSVHTALNEDGDACIDKALLYKLGVISNSSDYDRLVYSMMFAQEVAGLQNRFINVVVHVNIVEFYRTVSEYAEFINELLCKYDKVNLLIEHNTALTSSFGTRGVWKASDLPNFIRKIRSVLFEENKSRFGAVLDICHALGNVRMGHMVITGNLEYDDDYEQVELHKWFTEFSDV